MKLQNLIKNIIGVSNPYGLIQKAGKKTRRKSRHKSRNKSRNKSRHKSRNKSSKKIYYAK